MARRTIPQPEVSSLFSASQAGQGDVSTPLTAKPDQYVRFFFTNGINRSLPPNMIGDGEMWKATNCWYPKEAVNPVTRPGLRTLDDYYGTSLGTAYGRITAIHEYVKSDNTSIIVFACMNGGETDQELYYINTVSKDVIPLLQYNESTGVLETATVGNTTTPTFLTYNGHLLLGAKNKSLRIWTGDGASDLTDPARATATITCASDPAPNSTMTIAGSVFTFIEVVDGVGRTQPFEISIYASESAQATAIAAAVNSDLWNVSATTNGVDVVITATRTGTIGNTYTMVGSNTGGTPDSNVTVSAATLSGGVSGEAFDRITTYEAPTSSNVISSDRFGRIVVAGDGSSRVYFSAPGNAWSFASGDYGLGEYWDIATLEGNTITAITPFFGEVWVSKFGNNREMHRMTITDPLPASWGLTVKPHTDISAALNPRCSVTVGDQLLIFDKDRLHVFQGTDTTDEYRSMIASKKVVDLLYLTGAEQNTAFMLRDINNYVVYIMPRAGTECFVYHFSSGRWTYWSFKDITMVCGAYNESFNRMMWGADDGMIYIEDSDLATDNGLSFVSNIVGRTMEMQDLSSIVLKQTQIDYTHKLEGSASFGLMKNRSDATIDELFTFVIDSVGYTVDYLHDFGTGIEVPIGAEDGTPTGSATDLYGEFYFTTVEFDKQVDYTTDRADAMAPNISWTGSMEVNQVVLRVAPHGRTMQA